jgi:hypothetical protein
MKCLSEHLLADDETWAAILEPALCQDAASVDALARLLFTIKRAIDTEPDGVTRASRTLQNGIEQAYLHTDGHTTSRSTSSTPPSKEPPAGRR